VDIPPAHHASHEAIEPAVFSSKGSFLTEFPAGCRGLRFYGHGDRKDASHEAIASDQKAFLHYQSIVYSVFSRQCAFTASTRWAIL
jgi:hypothetical protein